MHGKQREKVHTQSFTKCKSSTLTLSIEEMTDENSRSVIRDKSCSIKD